MGKGPESHWGGRAPLHRRTGFALIELMLVVSVLLFTLLLFSQTMGSALRLTGVNRESGLAMNGARDMIERLQGEDDFSVIFVLYNEDPGDDPGVAGSAPGADFTVAGLDPADDDADGFVGKIRFPTLLGVQLELRENLEDEDFGTPRDLSGDDQVDEQDHAEDYTLLPVHVVLRWKGQSGVRTLEVHTLLADR